MGGLGSLNLIVVGSLAFSFLVVAACLVADHWEKDPETTKRVDTLLDGLLVAAGTHRSGDPALSDDVIEKVQAFRAASR